MDNGTNVLLVDAETVSACRCQYSIIRSEKPLLPLFFLFLRQSGVIEINFIRTEFLSKKNS